MASAAEQMAANISWSTFGKAKDLQNRILFALGLLIVYRIGTYIPVPGIDAARLAQFFEQASQGLGGMLNMFTGGAVGRMAIFALGIMPYISSSIIVQLLTSMVPSLAALKKEGEAGRKKINQYTRYGTVALATLITPVLALLLGAWLNQERVAAADLAGAGVILLGLASYQWGDRLRRRRVAA